MKRVLLCLLLLAASEARSSVPGLLDGGPPIEIMREEGGKRLATILWVSGDRGWATSMGRKAVPPLQWAGFAVVGLNSLAFFDVARTPQETALWIARAAAAPGAAEAGPVILVGHSFGADLLPAAARHLPPALAQRVLGVALVVPGTERFDRTSVGEFLGLSRGVDNRADGQWLAGRFPILCIRGADETDSLCPSLKGPSVTQITLPGGHFLQGAADRLGQTLTVWAKGLLQRDATGTARPARD